jgi:hypothetical protein
MNNDNTAGLLNKTLEDAQAVITAYLIPDGIEAGEAVTKLIPILDNQELFKIQASLEQRN